MTSRFKNYETRTAGGVGAGAFEKMFLSSDNDKNYIRGEF